MQYLKNMMLVISFCRFHWGAHCCWSFVLVLSQVAMLVLQPFNVLLLFNANVTFLKPLWVSLKDKKENSFNLNRLQEFMTFITIFSVSHRLRFAAWACVHERVRVNQLVVKA